MFLQWERLTPICIKIVEERTVVRIANRDTIVRIQRTRASIAPIVDIGEGSETTQTRLRSSTYNYVIANAKVMKNSDTTSQRAIFFLFFRLRHIKIWRDRLRRSVLKCSYAIHVACVSQSSSASQRNAPMLAELTVTPWNACSAPEPATPPLSTWAKAERPRKPEVMAG